MQIFKDQSIKWDFKSAVYSTVIPESAYPQLDSIKDNQCLATAIKYMYLINVLLNYPIKNTSFWVQISYENTLLFV